MRYQRVYVDSLGYELAPDVVSTAELEERLEPVYRALRIQPGQLEAMTGIHERRYWEPGFPVSRGAALAARKALQESGVPSREIGALVYGGVCRQHYEPATACHVAADLLEAGLPIGEAAAVLDLSNACLGVLSGMLDVANRIELGQIRAGLVVSCESAREIVETAIARLLARRDMDTFKTSLATLTGGSGAVAVVLTDGSFGGSRRRRLLGGVTRAEPRHHWLCRWGLEPPDANGLQRPFMVTDSVAVLEHGVELGLRTWRAFLAELGWTRSSVDRVISHQVGSAHRSTILRTLGLDEELDFVAYDFLGNTGTVALPLAAALAEEREFLKPGQRVAWLGIGSGLNCMMLGVDW